MSLDNVKAYRHEHFLCCFGTKKIANVFYLIVSVIILQNTRAWM